MPVNFGNIVAKSVSNGTAQVGPGAWVPLTADATGTPYEGRQWVQIQHRGQGGLCLGYSNMNADGTFTAPTYTGSAAKIIPAASVWTEPLSDTVQLYGWFVNKSGSTTGGTKVVITEYK